MSLHSPGVCYFDTGDEKYTVTLPRGTPAPIEEDAGFKNMGNAPLEIVGSLAGEIILAPQEFAIFRPFKGGWMLIQTDSSQIAAGNTA